MTAANALDLKGNRFGRLVAIARAGTDRLGRALWHCECDCGGFTKAAATSLRIGRVRSCGCYRREYRRLYGKRIDRKFSGGF